MSTRPADEVSTALYSGERLQPKYEKQVVKPKPLRIEQNNLKSNYSALTESKDPSKVDNNKLGEPIASGTQGVHMRDPAQALPVGYVDPAVKPIQPSGTGMTFDASKPPSSDSMMTTMFEQSNTGSTMLYIHIALLLVMVGILYHCGFFPKQ